MSARGGNAKRPRTAPKVVGEEQEEQDAPRPTATARLKVEVGMRVKAHIRRVLNRSIDIASDVWPPTDLIAVITREVASRLARRMCPRCRETTSQSRSNRNANTSPILPSVRRSSRTQDEKMDPAPSKAAKPTIVDETDENGEPVPAADPDAFPGGLPDAFKDDEDDLEAIEGANIVPSTKRGHYKVTDSSGRTRGTIDDLDECADEDGTKASDDDEEADEDDKDFIVSDSECDAPETSRKNNKKNAE